MTESELSERIRDLQSFESFLLDISACFINLPVTDIDKAIEDAQRHICTRVGIAGWMHIPTT
jgi:hypothetical protein